MLSHVHFFLFLFFDFFLNVKNDSRKIGYAKDESGEVMLQALSAAHPVSRALSCIRFGFIQVYFT